MNMTIDRTKVSNVVLDDYIKKWTQCNAFNVDGEAKLTYCNTFCQYLVYVYVIV